jgi:hypothetical protein
MANFIEVAPAASDIIQYKWKRRDIDGFMLTDFMIGIKTPRDRYIYLWLNEMNKFSTNLTKVPQKYKKTHPPNTHFLLKCIANPNMHRAVKDYMPRTANTKIYMTHDNGARPFVVYVDNEVFVYKMPEDVYIWREDWSRNPEDNIDFYTKLIYNEHYERIFIGKDLDDNPQTIGNSILVDLGDNNYMFIGDCIYKFRSDELITNYYSIIGNNDVPYPVAVSQSNIYFMLDRVWVKKSTLNVPEVNMPDAYRYFYDKYERAKKDFDDFVTRMDATILENRIF